MFPHKNAVNIPECFRLKSRDYSLCIGILEVVSPLPQICILKSGTGAFSRAYSVAILPIQQTAKNRGDTVNCIDILEKVHTRARDTERDRKAEKPRQGHR